MDSSSWCPPQRRGLGLDSPRSPLTVVKVPARRPVIRERHRPHDDLVRFLHRAPTSVPIEIIAAYRGAAALTLMPRGASFVAHATATSAVSGRTSSTNPTFSWHHYEMSVGVWLIVSGARYPVTAPWMVCEGDHFSLL